MMKTEGVIVNDEINVTWKGMSEGEQEMSVNQIIIIITIII